MPTSKVWGRRVFYLGFGIALEILDQVSSKIKSCFVPFCFTDIPVPWYWESDGNVEDFDTGEIVPAGIQGGYKVMKCPNCGDSYSVDDTDNEEMAEKIENLNPDGSTEIQTFIYHNYSVDAHAFSNYWIDMVDL